MKYKTINNKVTVNPGSRAIWRKWLEKHHTDLSEIWLVYYKKHTGKPSLTKAEANMEALCFGWVDSLIQGIDEDRYMQKFTPRKSNSRWSELNKRRVIELQAQGLMTPDGARQVDIARQSGEWDLNREHPEISEVPEVFITELEKSKAAKAIWNELSPAHRQQYLLWISTAKRDETKIRRSRKAINMMTSGQSPNTL
ncbi:MAG: YdeI/OmpD-associated family protein [Candidatus Marinimicrobia bacterium]|nr:YdeI/OmpD-associated family protein [Candidatus Neomarinimicrobiota bacterium]